MTTYTVTAMRGTTGRWVLQCVEYPGALSEARSLAQAPDLMREAIAFVAEVDPADVDVVLVPELPENTAAHVRAVREGVVRLARQQREVAALSRSTAHELKDSGLSGADIAAVMDVSPQRVSQLLNA